jgi:hypothetical protein
LVKTIGLRGHDSLEAGICAEVKAFFKLFTHLLANLEELNFFGKQSCNFLLYIKGQVGLLIRAFSLAQSGSQLSRFAG